MTLTGTKMTHVPYRGTGPALNDLVAGHVDLIFMELSSAYKLHDAGKARILAVATDKRLDLLKDIPTMIEVGVPDFVSDTWNAISAPPQDAGADRRQAQPRDERHHQQDADTKKRFDDLNLHAGRRQPGRHAQAGARTRPARWSDVIKKAGIQPE